MKPADITVKNVISMALQNLGLDEEFLLNALIVAGSKAISKIEKEILYPELSISDWIWIAAVLYIPTEISTDSWMRIEQCQRVGAAIAEGRFTLPMNDKVKTMLRHFYTNERKGIRLNRDNYSSSFLKKIILGRRKTIRERSLARLLNRKDYALEQEQFKSVPPHIEKQLRTVFPFGLVFSAEIGKEIIPIHNSGQL